MTRRNLLLFILLFSFKTAFAQEIPVEKNSHPISENSSTNEKYVNAFRKWEVSFGSYINSSGFYPNRLAERDNGIKLGLYYRLNPKLSIGYSHFHLESTRERIQFLPGSGFSFFQSNTFDLSNEIGLLNLRYVLTESFPVFLSIGFGREFRGRQYSSLQFAPTVSSSIGSRDFSPHFLLSMGFGYQKIFENGMLFGFSYNGMKSLFATYNDNSISNNPFIFVREAARPSESISSEMSINNILSLWAGFAF